MQVHPGPAGAQRVLDLVLSHANIRLKAELVAGLLARLVLLAPAAYRPQLRRIAALAAGVQGAAELANRAQQLLVRTQGACSCCRCCYLSILACLTYGLP